MLLATAIAFFNFFLHPGDSWGGQGSAVSVVREDHQEARAKSSCEWILPKPHLMMTITLQQLIDDGFIP